MKIGIIGLGLVGKSYLRFLQNRYKDIAVWDEKILDGDLSLYEFIQAHDRLFVSPGVDLRDYENFSDKFFCELDLFAPAFKKKTIAITGTLGKTSTTQLIYNYLPYKSALGGNIGRPMLELVDEQRASSCANEIDWGIIELSSFQLERNKCWRKALPFAPDIAIFTNFYPNHLDRHRTVEEYFSAKWRLFEHQKPGQFGLFSSLLRDNNLFREKFKTYRGTPVFVPVRPECRALRKATPCAGVSKGSSGDFLEACSTYESIFFCIDVSSICRII